MNILTLINALRFGQAVGRGSNFKYAGYVGLVAGFAFYAAKASGYLDGVSEEDWFGLVNVALDFLAASGLYTVVATNEKLGVLPKAKTTDAVDGVDAEWVRDELQTNDDKPSDAQPRSSGGFPDGPFWDS